MHVVVLLLLAVTCYGLPIKEQNKELSRLQNGQHEIYQDVFYLTEKSPTTETYSLLDKQANRLNSVAEKVFQSNAKGSRSTLYNSESNQGLNHQQDLIQGKIESNVHSQNSLEQTLLQDDSKGNGGTEEDTLNLIFQMFNQSDIGSNDKSLNLNNTSNDVNTVQGHGRSNQNTSEKKEIAANDQYNDKSKQELTQDTDSSVTGSHPISQSELSLLIKSVFGFSPVFQNESSEKREQEQDGLNLNENKDIITKTENENPMKSNFLKDVLGKNWDKENKPINQENLDTAFKNNFSSGFGYGTDEEIANKLNGDKPIQQFLRDVFGDNWDTENKPVSQKNLDTFLKLFGRYSNAGKPFDHAVRGEQSGRGKDTSVFQNKYGQQDWSKDYELPDLRPHNKDIVRLGSALPLHQGGYLPSTRQSDREVHDRQDYFGNGLDSQYLHHNGLERECLNCYDDHNGREPLTEFSTRSVHQDLDGWPRQGQYYHPDGKYHHRHFYHHSD